MALFGTRRSGSSSESYDRLRSWLAESGIQLSDFEPMFEKLTAHDGVTSIRPTKKLIAFEGELKRRGILKDYEEFVMHDRSMMWNYEGQVIRTLMSDLFGDQPSLRGVTVSGMILGVHESYFVEWQPSTDDELFALQAARWCGVLTHEQIHWKHRNAGYQWDVPFASAFEAVITLAWLTYFVPCAKWPEEWIDFNNTLDGKPTMQEVLQLIEVAFNKYRKDNAAHNEPPDSYVEGRRLGARLFSALDYDVFGSSLFLETICHCGGTKSMSTMDVFKQAWNAVVKARQEPGIWVKAMMGGWFGSGRTIDGALWCYAREMNESFYHFFDVVLLHSVQMLNGCNTDPTQLLLGDCMYWELEHAFIMYLARSNQEACVNCLEEIANSDRNASFKIIEAHFAHEWNAWTEQKVRIANEFGLKAMRKGVG